MESKDLPTDVRVDLDFRATPLCEATENAANQAGITIICDPRHAAGKTVTVRSRGVRLAAALDELMAETGLAWGNIGKAILVSTPDKIAQARKSLETIRSDYRELAALVPKVSGLIEEPLKAEFKDTPLSEAISYLQTMTKVSCILDPRGTESEEVGVSYGIRDLPMLEAYFWLARSARCEMTWGDALIYMGRRQEVEQYRTFGMIPSREIRGWDEAGRARFKTFCQARIGETKDRTLKFVLETASEGLHYRVVLEGEAADIIVAHEWAGLRLGRFLGRLLDCHPFLRLRRGSDELTYDYDFEAEMDEDRLVIWMWHGR